MVEVTANSVDLMELLTSFVFQDIVEESLVSLQARLSNLEGTMSYLPKDSIESMLSSLMVRMRNEAERLDFV